MSATTPTDTLTQCISASEIDLARTFLRNLEACLADAAQVLSESQWHYLPAPGQWSIAGILEHCALVQQAIIGGIREQLAAAPPGPNPDAAAVDQVFWTRAEDRSIKAHAPDFLHPKGTIAPEAARQSIRASNVEIIKWLESGTGLRERCIPGPPAEVLSRGQYHLMDGYQWILGAAGHLVRHAGQNLEIRHSSSFPAA